jgi:hypothetical protein
LYFFLLGVFLIENWSTLCLVNSVYPDLFRLQ